MGLPRGKFSWTAMHGGASDPHFSGKYHRLLDSISDDLILLQVDKFNELSSLSRDFKNAAVAYARVIIAERYLPQADKTIKSAGSSVGGFAGGEKYIGEDVSCALCVFVVCWGDWSRDGRLKATTDTTSPHSLRVSFLSPHSLRVSFLWDGGGTWDTWVHALG